MWISKKKYNEMERSSFDLSERFIARGIEISDLKKEIEELKEGSHKCDVYCKGCKHLIVNYKGYHFYSPEKWVCALDRKCGNYEVEGK